MLESYEYTPYIWPLLTFSVFFGVLSLYAWQRRGVPGARPLAIMMLLAVFWTVSTGLAYAAVDVPVKISWYMVTYAVFLMPITVARFCFALEFAGLGHWLTRRTLALLAIPILMGLTLVLTNDWHHWVWLGFTVDDVLQPIYSAGYWAMAVTGYALFLATLIVLARLFFRSPTHRWPVALILCAMLSTHLAVTFDISGINPATALDLTVLALSVSLALYALALFRFRMFDPILLARQTVIDQMQEGMVVLDTAQRIVDLNPAAEKILGRPAARLQQQAVTEVLPSFGGTNGRFDHDGRSQSEISLGSGSALRYYELIVSPLKHHNNLALGHLLLFHDVTEQKHAQAQLVEQQRALATLNEGERLARELHDSLGQVLGYASFQLDAASQLIRAGQTTAATEQLDRLAGIIRETHADVREHILNLRSAPSAQQPFFAALRQYLDGFANNYGIQTVLVFDERLAAPALPLDAQMQIFRILQEALSNARKHGHARCVQVTFAAEDHLERITVQDDGEGFDPSTATAAGGNHFGLQFMRERAEQLGGRLHVDSAPGAGTHVEVDVPKVEG